MCLALASGRYDALSGRYLTPEDDFDALVRQTQTDSLEAAMSTPFPNSMDFGGYNAPSRVECDVYDLVVDGKMPEEINGSWYRSIPDPQYSPASATTPC